MSLQRRLLVRAVVPTAAFLAGMLTMKCLDRRP
jgi:hypothetical protein